MSARTLATKIAFALGRASLVATGIIVFLAAIFIYDYQWGTMYGGKYYQRKAFTSEGKLLLGKYREQQKWYFEKHKKYNPTLHTSEDLYDSVVKHFKLGFKDVPVVAKYCPDCTFNDSTYKIAAYAKYESDDILWTLDRNGNWTGVMK